MAIEIADENMAAKKKAFIIFVFSFYIIEIVTLSLAVDILASFNLDCLFSARVSWAP